MLREREKSVPPEQSFEVAKTVKEQCCYVCPDIQREFTRYDTEPQKWLQTYNGINNITKEPFHVDVGYERFLGPEILFHPEMVNPEYTVSITDTVDEVI